MNATKPKHEPLEKQRQRILDAFVVMVKVEGLRAVSMLGLARKLGISTKTLYKHFPSKAEMIQAVVEQNDLRFNETRVRRILAGENAHQRILLASLEWLEVRSGFGDAFWHELQRDYSDVYTLFQQRLESFLERSAALLKPEIRPELNADHALLLLWKSINDVPSYEECEKLGLTRRDALTQSITIWARGSLKTHL